MPRQPTPEAYTCAAELIAALNLDLAQLPDFVEKARIKVAGQGERKPPARREYTAAERRSAEQILDLMIENRVSLELLAETMAARWPAASG